MIHRRKRKAQAPPPDLAMFQDFLNAVGTSVVAITPERKIIHMNTPAILAWGSDGIGTDCFRTLRGSKDVCGDCPLEEILSTHRWMKNDEMRMLTRKGWRTHQNLYLFAHGEDPRTRVIAIVSMDVHEKSDLHREVLRERELSRALLESVNSVVLAFGPDGSLQSMNKAAEELTGLTLASIGDGDWRDVLIPEESRADAIAYFSRPVGEERPKEPVLLPLLAGSGESRMVSWTYSPLLVPGDMAAGAIAMGQDVTERFTRRREAEKRAAELEIVNSVLEKVGASKDFPEMLAVSLDQLLSLPAYKAGAAYQLGAGATEAHRVAMRGFTSIEPNELMTDTSPVFPATAFYNKRIEIARPGTQVHPHVTETLEAEGLTGIVAIPVLPGGHPLGLLMLGYDGEPTAEEMGMGVLEACAEALELGGENAFLRVRAEQRAHEATALLKASQSLTGKLELADALAEVSREIAGLFGADVCGIFLFDEGTDVVRLTAGYPADAFGGGRANASLRVHRAAAEVAETLKPLAIYDVASDDRVPEYVSHFFGIKSSMHVPLVAEGRFIGTVYLAMTSRHREFTASEEHLLESFARQASIAIRNATLMTDLRETEERYRAIMENSGVGFFVHDGDNILYSNGRIAEITGYSTDELKTAGDVLKMCAPEDRPRLLELLRRRMAADPSVPREYDLKIRRKDGSTAVMQLVHTNMALGGRPVVLVAMNDVTARVEAEQAVKSSEERYRTLIESSRDGIVIADPDGKILFANLASTFLTGKTMREMVGQSIYDFVHPDEMGATKHKFKREWEAGRGVARFPVRSGVHGDDRFFEVTTAILGEPGPEANTMLIASDTTERVLAQRKLEESEEKYRTIVETTHDAIVVVNRAGEIVYANPAVEPLFGVTPEQAIGRNVLRFVDPEERDSAARELARDFRTGKAAPNLALRCVTIEGSLIDVEVNSGLVGWPGDEAIEIIVVRDITERRQREAERERQLKVEEALSKITARFVDPGDINDALLKTLEDLSTFLGGSHSFYTEIAGDGHSIVRSIEWTGESELFTNRMNTQDARDFAYLFPRLSAGEEIVFESVESLPVETRDIFRETFNIESFAALPVSVGQKLQGVIGYASVGAPREWSQQDIELLREVARTVSRALERKEFVEELGRSERFRTRITESIGEGLFVISNGVITWANSQLTELCGYAAEEIIGGSPEVLMPEPEQFSEIVATMVDSLLDGDVHAAEERLRRKDGTLIDVQFFVTSLGITDQGVGEWLVAVQDITEAKRMREEVAAAAQAYSTLFSSAGDAFFVHAEDGRILDANERAVAYTGRPRDELLTLSMSDIVPGHLSGLYDDLRRRVDKEGTITFESRVLNIDGTVLPVEATSRKTMIWGDSVVLSVLRDVSERKKAEDETARRAGQLASLNEIVKASTSSLDLDTVLEAILQVTAEVSNADAGMIALANARGKPPVTFRLKDNGEFHGHMGKMGMRELSSWLTTERQSTLLLELGTGESSAFDFVALLKQGGMAQALFMPLYSGDKTIGVMALGSMIPETFSERDIGFYDAAGAEIGVSIENALIYRELTAEHERLSLLYRSAQSISGELELQSLLDTTAAEAARAVGSGSAIIGLIEPGSDEFVFSAAYGFDIGLLRGIRLNTHDAIGGQVVLRKRTVLVPRPEERTAEERALMNADPVISRTGLDFGVAMPLIAGDKVVGVFGLARPASGNDFSSEDILLLEAIGRQAGVAIQNARLYEETREHLIALEIAHQELMILDRMKSDFVSTVSHELRSPLAVIEGFAKTLSEHFDRIDEQTQRESIEIILKKSIALEGLIENLLDMSRIEEGRLEVVREPFDIVSLSELVSEDQERIADLHDVRVLADSRPLIVIADRDKTEVALGNLVRNAFKFSPDGGAVVISVKEVDGMVEVSVSDQGIGIASDEIERVFDRFYQVDSSETRSFPGSGLGLYITKELVQLMGGSIRLSSRLGEGSVFTFTLPLAR